MNVVLTYKLRGAVLQDITCDTALFLLTKFTSFDSIWGKAITYPVNSINIYGMIWSWFYSSTQKPNRISNTLLIGAFHFPRL